MYRSPRRRSATAGGLLMGGLLMGSATVLGAGFVQGYPAAAAGANPVQAAPHWQAVAAKSPPGTPTFATATCLTATDCWAAGAWTSGSGAGTTSPLLEHWSGRTWALVPTPVAGAQLSRVSCSTAEDCWVAGSASQGHEQRPVVEHWDGRNWSDGVLPAVPSSYTSAYLASVSCISARSCFAVGGAGTGPGLAAGTVPLLFHWDGEAWGREAVPLPTGYRSADLGALYCFGATSCIADGTEIPVHGYFDRAFSESFNGKAWAAVQVPQPYHFQYSYSAAPDMTCLSAHRCLLPLNAAAHANGQTAFTPYLALWDGSSWSLRSVAEPDGFSAFADVACAASTDCWLPDGPGMDHWTGATSLSHVALPGAATTGAGVAQLQAVACVPAQACFALGQGHGRVLAYEIPGH